MQLNLNSLVTMTDGNKSLTKLTKIADATGAAVIMKKNQPKYVLVSYEELTKEDTFVDDIKVQDVAKNILSKHIKAFEELVQC